MDKAQRAAVHGLAWGVLGGLVAALVLPTEECTVTGPPGGNVSLAQIGFPLDTVCESRPNIRAGVEVGIVAGLTGAVAAYHS